MSCKFQSFLLSDVVNIIGGGTPKRAVEEYWNGEIPWLSVVDFNDGSRFVSDSNENITEQGLKSSSTKLLSPGQIIISARGTVGCLAQLTKPMAFNQSCYGLDAKTDVLINDYLYYLMVSKVNELKQKTHGAVFDTITRDTFNQIEIALPSLKIQEETSQILGSLDNKIELNRQINQTLEEMAQAMFKSWFVDFDPVKAKMEVLERGGSEQEALLAAMSIISGKSEDELEVMKNEKPKEYAELESTALLFPSTMVESELGLIPEGWEAKPLYSTAEYVNGSAFKSKDFSDDKSGFPIIKIAELKSGITNTTKFTNLPVKEKYRVNNGDVLYSWSGSPDTSLEVFKWFGGSGWLNQHIFKLNFESENDMFFTFFLLKQIKPLLISTAKQKQTTGLGHITVADMKRIKITYPNDCVLKAYARIVKPIYNKSSNVLNQNDYLASLRNTLLPSLLSGEIEVNETI